MTYPMSDRDREIQEEPLAAGWEARGELRCPGAARRRLLAELGAGPVSA